MKTGYNWTTGLLQKEEFGMNDTIKHKLDYPSLN